jgi:hypothetical protein
MPHRERLWYSGSRTVLILDKVLGALKDGLPVIASLDFMIQITFYYGSRYPCHAATVVFHLPTVNKIIALLSPFKASAPKKTPHVS